MAFHAHAHHGELADFVRGNHFAETDFFLQSFDDFLRFEQVGFVHRERKVGRGRAGAVADVLHDHVHIDGGVPERPENPGGNSGFVRHGHEGDFGLVFVE